MATTITLPGAPVAASAPLERTILPTLRKARLRDVPALFQLIHQYAAEEVMLPRALPELYEDIWEFTVAEKEGRVIACGALRLYNEEIAELRSLCVDPEQKTSGLGRAVANRLLHEARELGLKRVFALTVVPGFFSKMGFYPVERGALPQKVWRDCLQCEKYFRCDEKAMVFDLDSLPARSAHPHSRSA
ncbi:MAG TPA: N-acetyltransferase [Terriglobia bacterium]|nr:N-acetyltransferase [Terriglobia bacterium]